MRKALGSSELIAVNVLFCEGDKLNTAIECINKSEGTNAVATTTAANPTASNTKRWSLTEREIRLQHIFLQVVTLPQNSIDTNDNAFTLNDLMYVGAYMPRLALFDVVIDLRRGFLKVSVW
ncbi:hypothetical protein PENSOL_c065G02574 [Penicillium solitum]|uniref:Uncharacterized protein n=1 Tax=Penicillium solitum TaxID=60172 RepID=A0A1V6QJU6_9EURO|nr:uncharacterized protein PENSOL_c065G02574 [Penicillium solitum]OQD89252.1 hypothetical protein PENSOL_c065G02574 [Penicillium solitum]